MNRYLCIHGHFYQPPRENPWLEVIERQDSAHPYHDWNERITAECYAPNAVSRILQGDGKIAHIVNNYSWINFNFGPTLLHWMAEAQPEVYASILEADQASLVQFGGHGSALAQVYNHVILPLANERDKETQVHWGIRDFEFRFGRYPEGMWLAETAVDIPSLETLAAHHIKFTILAPHQARRIRPIQGGDWQWVDSQTLPITRPYRVFLPSGRSIDIFFYHGPVSRAVAFEKLLSSGDRLAHRMMDIFSPHLSEPQLAHIATDGETYGHHHPHGDMALAYALHMIKTQNLAHVTNYSAFLEKFPATWEVEIHENTSWSCAHGIDRWRDNCGCNSGGHPGWQQRWRKPLRETLNWLRDQAIPLFSSHAKPLFHDIWQARNDYIHVVLDRSNTTIENFFQKHQKTKLTAEQQTIGLQLLEMQRHLQLMYTSCAWFFDEISGIETVQVLKYAGRAMQIAERFTEESWQPRVLQQLEQAPSNVPEYKHGRHIYELWVEPNVVDFKKAVKHYAVLDLFGEQDIAHRVPVFSYYPSQQEKWEVGRDRLSISEIEVTSSIIRKKLSFQVAVLFFGKYNIAGAICEDMPPETYARMVREFKEAFLRADITQLYRLFAEFFQGPSFDMSSLFRDQQSVILSKMLESTMTEVESLSHQLYHRNASLIRYLMGLQLDLPNTLRGVIHWVLLTQIQKSMESERLDRRNLQLLMQEAKLLGVALDQPQIALGLQEGLVKLSLAWQKTPLDIKLLERLQDVIHWVSSLPFHVDLYRIQNIFYRMHAQLLPVYYSRRNSQDPEEKNWSGFFATLNNDLQFQPL